jgi:hypothetical protein
MNNAFMVGDSISPSTQNVSNTGKNNPTSSFQDVLSNFLGGESVQENSAAAASVEDAQSEQDAIFEEIQKLLLLSYVQADTDEEEESDSGGAGDGKGDAPDITDKPDPLLELRQIIDRTRDRAMEMNGGDKNKYALEILSASEAKQAVEAEAENPSDNKTAEGSADVTEQSAEA